MSEDIMFRRRSKTNRVADVFFDLNTGKTYQILGIGKVGIKKAIHELPDRLYYPVEQYSGYKSHTKPHGMIYEGDRVKVIDEDDKYSGIATIDYSSSCCYLIYDNDPNHNKTISLDDAMALCFCIEKINSVCEEASNGRT